MSLSLLEALMAQGYEKEEALNLIAEMRERMFAGEDPEDLLYEEGLESDYVFDLLK